VGEETSEETIVEDQIWAQARETAWCGVGVAGFG
jgi:hypothetical protein